MMKIVQDLDAYGGGWRKHIVTILINPCFHATVLYRLSNVLYKLKLKPLAKVIWYINRMLFSVDIDYRANLAGGLVLVHGIGVVIGKDVVSEGKLKVYQGVTIGGSGKTKTYRNMQIDMPIIKDNVIIYTDAKIFGPVIINNNSVIKAGVIVTEDVL